jgi:type VI secretion system protein ImpG
MEQDDALYKNFLAELEALEKFRMGYTAQYTAAPLGREDQDVRRLIEALALFSARTRLAGQRAIARGALRLFQQHFPYMLSPMPAMAMLQAMPKRERVFVDSAELPRGTRVLLSPSRPGASARQLTFRTLAPLRLQPLRLTGVRTFGEEGREAPYLQLEFVSDTERADPPGSLWLYVNHLNDFLSSLTVYHQLKKDWRQAWAFFGKPDAPQGEPEPLKPRFGLPPPPLAELEPFEHPLQRLRTFFHHPQQELFLELPIPKPPSRWRSFTVRLELASPWPSELTLTRDTFVLHAVPMVNLQRDMSTPIEHDGTKERHGVQHPDPGGGYRVHSILGVYRIEEKGLQPLRPGVLSNKEDTYELEQEGQGEARRTWLSLNLPHAFDQPVRVAIEAFWHQALPPEFDARGYRVGLAGRYLEGLDWGCVGSVVPSLDNYLEHSPQDLLRLLAIRNQRFLEREDLLFLLEFLGGRTARYFRPVVERLSHVKYRSKPFAKSTTGFKYIYHLTFSGLDPLLLPTLDLFSARVLELLRAWSTEDVVELEVSLSHQEKPVTYPPREDPR